MINGKRSFRERNEEIKTLRKISISSQFSRNSEANVSEFLENREEMFSLVTGMIRLVTHHRISGHIACRECCVHI